jgi:hypothetical protein
MLPLLFIESIGPDAAFVCAEILMQAWRKFILKIQ